MKIYQDISLLDFHPWSGAVRTYDRLYNAGMLQSLEAILEDEYPDGIDATELNDLLWFDSEWVLNLCGLRGEDEILSDIADARSQIDDLMSDYLEETREAEEGCESMPCSDLKSLWEEIYDENYRDEIEELEQTIFELEKELESI
jgi:hypothetical protein